MRASEKAISLIKEFEGSRLEAYRCPAGAWTIGYGHTSGVKRGDVIDAAKADGLLRGDIAEIESFLGTLMRRDKVELDQGQYDALVCFAFNVGIDNLAKSTLWRKVKTDPADPAIIDEFGRWVHAGGARLKGLVRRRAAEAKLWKGGE